MNRIKIYRNLLLAMLLALALVGSIKGARAWQGGEPPADPEAALGTAFTYQGQLQDNGALANGSYDFQFVLYNAAVGGAQVGGTPVIQKTGVGVTNGKFTTQLDFGNVFGNSQLFLEIGVRPAGNPNPYNTLSPRQEITPAPYARYAMSAGSATSAQSAVSAQSVPWSGITGKPQALSLRKIYVAGGAFGHPANANFAADEWGLLWKNSSQNGGFVVPKPADWDITTPITVTLYFALPTVSTNTIVNWRLWAGGNIYNSTSGNATTGWDSLDYGAYEDATPLTVYAAGGHTDLVKVQSWSTKWSSTYGTWYFGSSVTVANSFSTNPIWHFEFIRGASSGNGETYIGDMIVLGAEVRYLAVH